MHRFSLFTQLVFPYKDNDRTFIRKKTTTVLMATAARLITGNSSELLPLPNQWLTLNDLGVFHLNITEASWKTWLQFQLVLYSHSAVIRYQTPLKGILLIKKKKWGRGWDRGVPYSCFVVYTQPAINLHSSELLSNTQRHRSLLVPSHRNSEDWANWIKIKWDAILDSGVTWFVQQVYCNQLCNSSNQSLLKCSSVT